MFVIIEAWNNLSAAERQLELPEKVALTMKHAGVSITVTSITNFAAFAIGSTTVSHTMPSTDLSLSAFTLVMYTLSVISARVAIVLAMCVWLI